jgi:hypothetical protein
MDFDIRVIKIKCILLIFTSIDRKYPDNGKMCTVRGFIFLGFKKDLKQ